MPPRLQKFLISALCFVLFALFGRWQMKNHQASREKDHRSEIAAKERTLGPEHPDTLKSRDKLALDLAVQHKTDEAVREMMAILVIRERVLGSDHPDTVWTRLGVAHGLFAQGKHAEAEKELRTLLSTKERLQGAEDVSVLKVCVDLAECLTAQGRFQEALEFSQSADRGFGKLSEPYRDDLNRAKYVREQIELKLNAQRAKERGK